jgi:hypothetical protein
MRMQILLASLLLVGVASADEKKIAEAALPKAVRDGLAKKYPTEKRLGWSMETEEGKTTYEAQIVNAAGHRVDVDVSPDGKILAEEETLANDGAPDPVKKALSASPKYRTWTVKKTEKVLHADHPDAPEYELVVSNGKSFAELVFAPDGKLLRTEEKKRGED